MTLLEGDAIEFVRGEEHAVLQHAVEQEVLFDLGIVERVVGFLHLLGVVLPIPRREFDVILVRELLHARGLALGLGDHGGDHVGHQLDRVLGLLRHLVVEAVCGPGREAEQLGLLRAQFGLALDRCARVVGVAVRSALGRGMEQFFARRTVLERYLRGLLRRVLQRHDPLALKLATLGGLRCCGEIGDGEAREIVLVVDHEAAGLGCGEQLLLEIGGKRGIFLVQLAQLRLIGRRQLRARAHEGAMVAFDQIFRLGVQAECVALLVQRLHARVQLGIEINRILMRGELRRDVRLDLL